MYMCVPMSYIVLYSLLPDCLMVWNFYVALQTSVPLCSIRARKQQPEHVTSWQQDQTWQRAIKSHELETGQKRTSMPSIITVRMHVAYSLFSLWWIISYLQHLHSLSTEQDNSFQLLSLSCHIPGTGFVCLGRNGWLESLWVWKHNMLLPW